MSRIVRLSAENYKRIVAVDISPDGNVVTLSGKNRQGKSSILDAMFAALQGGRSARETSQPIRDGQDVAWVRLEIGDDSQHVEFIVTRRWTKDDAGTLSIEAPDGAKYSSPQKLLDELVGRVSFDPASFLDLSAKEQVDALVDALGDSLPFKPADLAAARKGAFDRRTEVGREVTRLEGQVAGFPSADPSLPVEEVSAADLVAKADAAREHNAEYDARAERIAHAQAAVEVARERVTAAEQDLKAAKQGLANVTGALDASTADLRKIQRVEVPDVSVQLAEIDATNRRIRQERERKTLEAQLSEKRQEQAQYTAQIQLIDKQKADGIAAAKFPVPELSFTDEGVTYNGIPFGQASTAEQLRAAFGVAIAANPQLRVCRIDKGESLDADSLALLGELAGEHQMQVWIAKVSDAPVGIVIEDGSVVEQ